MMRRLAYTTDYYRPAVLDTICMAQRVGIGHDTHRLAPNRLLRLGGIQIPHHSGLVGHSDADVLLHAVADAVLGAVGAGDIGEWFPDNDPQYKDCDSRDLLRRVIEQATRLGFRIVNLDCIVFAQEPTLGPYKRQIRQSLAAILSVPIECVNVKAKSGELVGSIGRREAIAAQAVVLCAKLLECEQ